MIEFAVTFEGIEEGKARWVLVVDPVGERLLLSTEDGSFIWRPIADCKLVRAATPDQPRMMIPVQPQQQSGLIAPVDNRAMRRNGHLN